MIIREHDDNVNFKIYNDTHNITEYVNTAELQCFSIKSIAHKLTFV